MGIADRTGAADVETAEAAEIVAGADTAGGGTLAAAAGADTAGA